jgi:branched-chain amino acid transport system ATP-binding protein
LADACPGGRPFFWDQCHREEGRDFQLDKGELRCLIGPNGAGKTTFFKRLTGRLRPSKGEMRFKGAKLVTEESFRIARDSIGIKTQVPSLFEQLTAPEHLWLALRSEKSQRDRQQKIDQASCLIRPSVTSIWAMIMPSDHHLVLKDVSGGYGRIPILFDVDLTVRRGEMLSLLGNNGMGKSTLLRAIADHLPDVAGTFKFEGRFITRDRADQRANAGIGYVPQGRQICPDLTALENLKMGAIRLPPARAVAKIDEVLSELPRLRPILDRRGGVLSGGEQQILALGRALCGSPSLLLLDEPTEGIQPSIVGEIRDLLGRLSERGDLTVVLVEQNLRFLVRVARRIHVIRKGRLSGEIDVAGLSAQGRLDRVAELAAL